MRPRRGVALLAALWLVVAIATVALQFSLEARERRTVGILAGERGIQRGLAEGALAFTRARMEQDLRVAPSGTNANVAMLRASDPWLDAGSVYGGPVLVDSTPVNVVVTDLGQYLNLNRANELELQTFFSFLLKDFEKSTRLAQAIMDWRDPDSLPRPSGGERDAYIKAELLALPTNSPFRDIEDLRNVIGMTPEIYAEVKPYLTVYGNGQINVNTAPEAVLRSIQGMTDATLFRILQYRSQGRRITQSDMQSTSGGRQTGTTLALLTQIATRVVYATTFVEVVITARTGPQSSPTKLIAVLQKVGDSNVNLANVIW